MPLWYSCVTYGSSTCHCDIILLHTDPVPVTVIFYCFILIQDLPLWYSTVNQFQYLPLRYSTVTYRSNTCKSDIPLSNIDPVPVTLIFYCYIRSRTCHCDILLLHIDPVPATVIFYCHIQIQYLPMWYSSIIYRSSTSHCDILLLHKVGSAVAQW